MKKSLILAGLLSIGYAHAQEERVGINTVLPDATLTVKTKVDAKTPKNLELENEAETKLVTVLNNGKVGFNTENPDGRITIYPSGSGYSDNSIYHHLISNASWGGEYGFKRARGTKEALETVRKGDEIANLNFIAYTNKYVNAATITASVADVDDAKGAFGRLDISLNKKVGSRQVLRIDNTGYLGLGRAVSTPLAPLHIETDAEDITAAEVARGQKDDILINLRYGGQDANTKERRRSISSIEGGKRLHNIDFGLINPAATTTPFMAFRVAPDGPKSEFSTVEHMRIMHTGNIGMGTTAPTHKLHIVATENPLKLEGLQETSDTSAKNLVVVDGVVKIGAAPAGITSEVDGVIGNEVKDATADRGLERSGNGDAGNPYTLGIKDGGVTGGMLANGSVTGEKLAANAVDASKLANGAVTSEKLNIGGTVGQVLTYKDGKWVAADAPVAPAEVDGVIGNEVKDVITDRGLVREGKGTEGDPYKVGLIAGTKDGDTLVWSQTENKWKVQASQNSASKVIKKFRTVQLPLAEGDWEDDDFTIRITGLSPVFELPNPATNEGRVIALRNGEGTLRTISKHPPLNNTTISGNRGMLLHSDGSNWHVIGGF